MKETKEKRKKGQNTKRDFFPTTLERAAEPV